MPDVYRSPVLPLRSPKKLSTNTKTVIPVSVAGNAPTTLNSFNEGMSVGLNTGYY